MKTLSNETEVFLRVSKNFVWTGAALLVLLTVFLMWAIMRIDFDVLLNRDELALKVGGTAITKQKFARLKLLAGPQASKLSDAAFAKELFETLLLAEGGRKLGLDKQKDFQEKIAAFDRAANSVGNNDDLSKALFLIEELAERTRNYIMAEADSELSAAGSLVTVQKNETASSADFAKLHLRTILVKNASEAAAVLSAAAAQTPFSVINASWSKSPYAAVNGDMGWVSRDDLPPGVYERLEKIPVGSIAVGFSDSDGIRLFLMESRPSPPAGIVERTASAREAVEHRRQKMELFLNTMRVNMHCYIHPSLQN